MTSFINPIGKIVGKRVMRRHAAWPEREWFFAGNAWFFAGNAIKNGGEGI